MKIKFVLIVVTAALSVYGVTKLSSKKDNKFTLTAIQSNRPFDPLFETEPLSPLQQTEVDHALDQSYTYYGCGGQAFVFFSNDGNYVLKFFKQTHFNPPTYLNSIPFMDSYRTRKLVKHRKNLERDYGSYKIGFEKLSEETQLLYIHLNKTSHIKKHLKVKDKLGLQYSIDLDQTDFILQRKADLVHRRIEMQMAKNDIEGAKQTISQILNLIVTRCKKGYEDRDPNIATNCGILGGKAIKIDVGRFAPNPNMAKPLYFKPELYYLTRPFHTWLKQHYPQLVPFLDDAIIHIIAHD